MKVPDLVRNDPWLEPFTEVINRRQENSMAKISQLSQKGSLADFASGHLYFGLHRDNKGWVFREWAPNATRIYIIGNFNQWKEEERFSLNPIEDGNWELCLPFEQVKHGDLYRLLVHWEGGKGDRIPSYANYVIQDPKTLIFNAQVWNPEKAYNWKNHTFKPVSDIPFIYEAHVGMATEEERIGSFNEFRTQVLPKIADAGYNVVQLMAIQEHPYYGSFGYHVSNYFAVSSRFGTPDELKELIDDAHNLGLSVIMDLVHSHAVKNENEGLGRFDGTPFQYFHDGYRREHVAWDSLCFDYKKNEVLHFLLSNCRYWIEEYKFDGFRFDGVTSMLYLDHGLSRDFTSYHDYFDGNQDEDAIVYLALANLVVHEINPAAITIAEEMSGMPGSATPVSSGGMGFDFRLAMGTPDFWIKVIKEIPDEGWNVQQIFHELSGHRADEKTIGYAESHDQALVGDKTIIFRLIDKEMYFHMSKGDQKLETDRGIALHKMIRLCTISTAGGGYLTFMGNEFGHPEWIDFPREGNNWSYKYARRQWSLRDNLQLKYHYLSDFDKEMVAVIKKEKVFKDPYPFRIVAHEEDQILVFKRGTLLFVFNFNPGKSFTDYGIPVDPGSYSILLNSDDIKFGGQGLVDKSLTYYPDKPGKIISASPYYLKLYIPSRTALVFKHSKPKSVK